MLRRLPLSRLLMLCGLVLAIGVSLTAIALAIGGTAKPPAKPLAQAVHDALSAPAIEGVSAEVTLTDHLLEGANLAEGAGQGGGGVASNPLISGASGRLWIAKDGRLRLELQSEKGDTEIVYDGHTISAYDAASNTVYRYTPSAKEGGWTGYAPLKKNEPSHSGDGGQVPSVAKIEQAIAHIRKHAGLSEATPDVVAGQPAYTVRLSPKEGGSLLGGAELSFDADNGVPLRSAIYSSTSSAPVIELAAGEVSFGSIPPSVFQISPPPGAKVEELSLPTGKHGAEHGENKQASGHPSLTTHGKGLSSIAVIESKADKNNDDGKALDGLPKVEIDGVKASELRTELGTVLTFERSGVRFVLAGAVAPGAVEALAKGL
jgi:outer membrane lipoprotein-sorting protein